jgi:2-methylcitrate dehydratase PrpD
MQNDHHPAGSAVSERLARLIAASAPEIAPHARQAARRMLLDISGLCVAARGQAYVEAALATVEPGEFCTVIGASQRSNVEGAAFVNGIAAHGEDFDDTYEGGPVHAGVVVVPAILATAERHGLSGMDLLRGIAVGTEVMCRLCRVAPKRVHKAGFHPTSIFGVMGAVAGIGAAMRLPEGTMVNAFGIAGSMASGIIEYLTDGAWTKRMHPGWAAQSGYRAIRLAMAGFQGPRTVFEGRHGLFHGFANTLDGDFESMLDGYAEEWLWQSIAFKPYACGTMAHPYIDCAREFRKKGIDPEDIEHIECETAEGIVHRLWEPLAAKHAPPNGYAAKFSIPYAIAAGILRDDAGLREYEDAVVRDAAMVRLASKVSYIIDPHNPYPDQFTGHIRVTLKNGEVHEHRQGFFRGGADHPMPDRELERKFFANCAYGGLSQAHAAEMAEAIAMIFDQSKVDIERFTIKEILDQ